LSFILVLGTAFALALDAFAVSVGISSAFPLLAKRNMYRVALHFGLFQFGMPIAGWLAGNSIQDYIRSFSHWIAFGLLLFIGGKMIFESFIQFRSRIINRQFFNVVFHVVHLDCTFICKNLN